MTSEPTFPAVHSAGDLEELDEWSESFDQLLAAGGRARAGAVLRRLGQQAADVGLDGYETVTTDYVNTIAASQEPEFPGDEDIERSYRRLLRWNASAWVGTSRRTPARPPCTR
ncbi:MAG: aceE [Nocardioidaceae bacterium]|nr:aceE [Nocardioidaceae bacterium]